MRNAGGRKVADPNNNSNPQDIRPSPDPTRLTTAQLLREITSSKEFGEIIVKYTREIVESKIEGVREVLEARLNGNDQAVTLLRTTTDKFPAAIEAAVKNSQTITEEKLRVQDEKFRSIDKQFDERDTRSDKSEVAQKTAVDAALAGAEKAVGKTELSFTKQIDQIGQRIDTVSRSADEKISDLKERIQGIESRKKGAGEVLGYVIGAAGVLVALFVFLNKPSPVVTTPMPPNAVVR
jgi:hypothetical protein